MTPDHKTPASPTPTPDDAGNASSQLDPSRRRFLAACGKYTAYTVPATMLLLTSEKAIAQSGIGGGCE
jgi:hypothetical protein